MWIRLLPPLLLMVLTVVFFAPLAAHPDQVLYSDTSDTLGLHLPAKRFQVAAWHETGELPLWCPYSYGGAPFLHDIQVGHYYPAHLLLLLLPTACVGPGLSWIIVLHVLIAGWAMYAYARSDGLGVTASLVAGFGYMFAGRWLLQVLGGGHYIVIGLAWLPLLLLCLERAIRRSSLVWASAAGVFFALIVLVTQPQWTFYAGLFTGLWTLGTALQTEGFLGTAATPQTKLRALARWLGCGAWAGLLAVGLAAATFLPALEGARYATRSAGVVEGADASGGGMRTVVFLVGPALTTTPLNLQWEDRGGLTLLWLAAAAMAPVLCRGRLTRYRGLVLLLVLLFAFGGSVLFQPLPGFRLFRQPARMALLAAFPVAYLAGVTTQKLFAAGATLDPTLLRRCRRLFVLILVGLLILTGGTALRVALQGKLQLAFHLYWVSLLLTVPITFWLLTPSDREGGTTPPQRRLSLWIALLAVDSWALVWPLVAVRSEDDIYRPSACVRYVMDHNTGHPRVLDNYEPDLLPNIPRDSVMPVLGVSTVGFLGSPMGQGPWLATAAFHGRTDPSSVTPLGLGAPLAMIYRLEALRGYNPLDVLRYKEYLQMIGDKDEPLRPFTNQLTYPVMGEFPIKNRSLFDLLGVRYLLRPQELPPDQEGWRQVALDTHPRVYDFSAGMIDLVPYVVWENESVMPRAFIVREAAALPQRPEVLATLKKTDLRRVVLLEDMVGGKNIWPPLAQAASTETGPRSVAIRSYQPNEIMLDVAAGPAGYLVLADVWFPGWTCTVGGISQPVHRADFLFRAVEVPAGPQEVVFRFEPQSYYLGRWISGAALLVIVAVFLFAGVRRRSLRPGQEGTTA